MRKLLATEPASKGAANLCTDGTAVVLEPAEWLSVDTHSFACAVEALLAFPKNGGIVPSAEAMEKAAGAYSGLFLDGNESDWIIAERERLHSLYVRCLTELLRVHAREGRHEQAISAARRILAVDAFRESIQRALALLLVVNGQRAQAIRELRQWAEAIKREIGVGPMPETTKLELGIVTGKIFDELPALMKSYFASPSSAQNASD